MHKIHVTRFWRHISVEPALFFYFLAYQIVDFLNTNLYLQKSCRNGTLLSEPDINTPCDDEQRGLAYVTTVFANAQFVSGLLTNLFTMYACIYSDLVGRKRKPFIILPILAILLQILSACLQVTYWTWSPLVGIILNVLLSNLGGGLTCFMIFVKVYICDESENKNRHTRITILIATRSLCNVVGKGMSGHLLHKVGFFYSYLFCTTLTIIALLFAVVLIKDRSDGRPVRLKSVFSLRELVRSFKIVMFSTTRLIHRIAIFILLVLCILVYFNTIGTYREILRVHSYGQNNLAIR